MKSRKRALRVVDRLIDEWAARVIEQYAVFLRHKRLSKRRK